ncbi:MAG: MFS transporter [Actinomycetota bacterium]|nr:MFS transporter [Actinomycetota bacterium]
MSAGAASGVVDGNSTTTTTPTPPASSLRGRVAASPQYRRWLLVSVLFGLFTVNFTITIFNVALVRISHEMHTTATTLTWAITGPLLVVGVSAPALGKLGDLRGHRKLYLGGLYGAIVGAALTVVAWNAGSLIGARLIAAVETACLTASSWSLLFRVFAPGERTKVLGWWSLVAAGGPVIGVAIGGPVTDAFGWRWIFVAQVPLVGAALIANHVVLSETPRSLGRRLDVPGAVTLALTVGSLLFALNRSTIDGWTSPPVLISGLLCPAALMAFVVFERRSAAPLFPLEWLSRRNFVLPCVASFGMSFAYMGGFFLTPLFLERGFGYGVGETGVLQIARPLVFAVAAPVAGYLATRTGERSAVVTGSMLMGVSMVMFSLLDKGSGIWPIMIALGISGLAMGVAGPAVAASVANAVEVEHMGAGSAGLQVANQVGQVAGIQVMETVQAAREHTAGIVGSFQNAYWAGGLGTVVAVIAALGVRNYRRRLVSETTSAADADADDRSELSSSSNRR